MTAICCLPRLARCLLVRKSEGHIAGGAMEHKNLAAAIVKFAGWEMAATACDQHGDYYERLTNEQAINLVDWLQSGPSLNTWRNIQLIRSARVASEAVPAQAPRAIEHHPK